MICPDCRGEGVCIADHVSYANGSHGYNVPLKCTRCQGIGVVPDAMADWIERGRAMREQRVNVERRSLRDEAKRRGMNVVTLSQMEQGAIEPLKE